MYIQVTPQILVDLCQITLLKWFGWNPITFDIIGKIPTVFSKEITSMYMLGI